MKGIIALAIFVVVDFICLYKAFDNAGKQQKEFKD